MMRIEAAIRQSGRALATWCVAGALLVASSGAAYADSGKVVDSWTDSKDRPILLREGTYDGSNGFGWIKIFMKHKIMDANSVRVVTSAPNGGVAQGNDRVYEVVANKMKCDKSNCKVVASVPVRAVVNMKTLYSTYYGIQIDGYVGVKTVYCLNDDAASDCPSWVDAALHNGARTVK